MEKINIGVIKYILTQKNKDIFLQEDTTIKNTEIIEFLNVVKNSPILKLENKVFQNIENKTILNESLAMRYIDKNIKLFEVYTKDELINEHKKIEKFLNGIDINETKEIKLYNAITDLIIESISENEKIDVDTIHESFIIVLNHVMEEKNKNEIENTDEIINEEVLKIAINKFNEKYSKLNENEFKLLNTLLEKDFSQKMVLFEEFKNNIFDKLNNINDDSYKEKIDETVNKINLIVNTETNIDDNILNLYELSEGLKDGIE